MQKAVILSGILLVSGCASSVDHEAEVASPSGVTIARVESGGRVLAGLRRTKVWLKNRGAQSEALIFSAPSPNREPLPLKLAWVGESRLEITFPRGTQVESKPDSYSGVAVVYREASAPDVERDRQTWSLDSASLAAR